MSTDQLEALEEVLHIAVQDQEHYLDDGDFHTDYGDEWPESARRKAERFRMAGDAVTELGASDGLRAELYCLAQSFTASAHQYEADHEEAEAKG